MTKKRELIFIEVARTVAIFFVVLIHFMDLLADKAHPATVAGYTFTSFAISVFFLVSGYLIGWKYLDRKKPFDASKFLRSKVYTIAIPFFAWNAIYIVLLMRPTVNEALSYKVLWPFTTGMIHLWFLFVILQLFVIYVLFFPKKGSSRAQTTFFAVALVLTLLFNVISELVYLKYGADNHHFEWTYGKIFVAWITVFTWGIIIGARPTLAEWLRNRLWLILAGSLAVFAVYYYQELIMALADGYICRQYFRVSGFVFQMFAATFTFFASESFVRWAQENGRFTKTINHMVSLGGYSYGIYLNHLLFIILILYLFDYLSVPLNFWIRFPIVLPITFLLSWAGVKVFTSDSLSRIYPILYGRR